MFSEISQLCFVISQEVEVAVCEALPSIGVNVFVRGTLQGYFKWTRNPARTAM